MSMTMKVTRRGFIVSLVGAAAAVAVGAQEEPRTTTGAPMSDDAYRPVRLAAKPGVEPRVTDAQRDDLEHHIQCQCGCTMDVYTCRTTDFSCPVSPRMHADVMGLVAGGYDADEILAAFQRVFGERVLMSPVKEGFNWVGYTLPFGAIAAASVGLFALLKHWSRPEAAPIALQQVDATPTELARLQEAMRNDE